MFVAYFYLDPYRGQGTIYLHQEKEKSSNPTGAVVVPISLATTFEQATPGQPTAPQDPNSFGLGYEYSRTGEFWIGWMLLWMNRHSFLNDIA